MSESFDKEVYFALYCPQCKYFETPEYEDPCNDCLAQPSNTYSHKPVMFEKKENKNETQNNRS